MKVMRANQEAALDMAFGEAPEGLSEVDMFCQHTDPEAIHSIVVSAQKLKRLDLRGNGLDANFGWKLISGMKNFYLGVENMNGMNLRAVKENKTRNINLAGYKSKSGIFGIEAVGAIFLAHFLMINKSVETLRFQNNNVGREGAKALGQAILTNPDSRIRTVNHMGKRLNTAKGIDFLQFRKQNVKHIDLAHCGTDDDDIVFLHEWLEKFDCVESLDLSHNALGDESVYKLQRFITNTQHLKKLNLANAPLEASHLATLTKALHDNKTLLWVYMNIGRVCGIEADKQQILHDLAMVIAKHPTIKEFGDGSVRLDRIKGNQMGGYDPLGKTSVTSYRNDIAMGLWLISMCQPRSFTSLSYNNNRRPDNGQADVVDFAHFYWPPICSICLHCKESLIFVDLGIPEGHRGIIEAMKFLAGSTRLQKFNIRGYSGADIKTLPQEWDDDGNLPGFIVDQLGPRRNLWRALNGFTTQTPVLEMFNNVAVGKYKVNSAERAMLLLLETCLDTSCSIVRNAKSAQTVMVLALDFGVRADVAFALNCTRLVDASPYSLEIGYMPKLIYKRDKVIAQRNDWTQMSYQQHDLATFLAQQRSDGDFPFVHHIALKYPFVVPVIVDSLATNTSVRSFTVDAMEKILPTLVKSLHAGKQAVKLEHIQLKRYWNPRRKVLKKFHEMAAPTVNGFQKEAYSERDLLRALQAQLIALPEFQGITTPKGTFDKKSLSSSDPEDFAEKMSGVLVQYPPVAGVYSPSVMMEFVFDPKHSKYPPPGYRRLGMMLPLAPAHRSIRYLNLSNCMLKQEIRNTARSDEFADSSRPLWDGKMVNYRPNVYGPFDEKPMDYATYKRFHWQPNVRIGSSDSEKLLQEEGFIVEKDILKLIIVTLLRSTSLGHLDLRGNGFDKDDIMIIIQQLEDNKYLKTLNGIPVIASEASRLTRLEFEGTGIPDILPNMRETNTDDRAFGQDTCKYQTVELDEGDGFLFASLITPGNFSKLKHISLTKHRIPDTALTYVCDALATIPALESLDLSRLYVSNRGANMLLSVICQRAQNIRSLNGLPLSVLQKETKDGASGKKVGGILWNEYTLAVATRLKLWSVLCVTDESGYMELDTRGLTDVGLRGVAGKLKHESMNSEGLTLSLRSLPLVKLDLSGNKQISDMAVADLTRNLLQPNSSPALVYLDIRYCPKLRARSAFELYYLLHPKSNPEKPTGAGKLQTLNGIDIKMLRDSVLEGKAAPPFVVRLYAGGRKLSPALSECDSHFLAHVLHVFPNVSHIHVHCEIMQRKKESVWRGDTVAGQVDGDSPFPPPADEPMDEAQRQICATRKFFECCPVSTRTQFSAIPRPSIKVPPTTLQGDVIVPVLAGAMQTAEAGGYFGQIVQTLLKRKELKKRQKDTKKPYYVNNINAQRVHDCFRTLYGVDDIDLLHEDVIDPRNRRHRSHFDKVDFSSLFSSCSSIDIQHCWFAPTHHLDDLCSGADMKHLSHLNFNFNNFGDPGLRQLCKILVANVSQVVHMSLSNDNISDAGVRHLCSAFPHLTRLTSLNLSHNFITETGAVHLADVLGGHDLNPKLDDTSKLLSLDLEGNKMRETGAMRFAEFITVNKHMQFLNLRDNEIAFIHDEAVAALVYCVTDNSVLSLLDMRDNFQVKEGSRYLKTKPPKGLIDALVQDVSIADFDVTEVYEGIFIRRKR